MSVPAEIEALAAERADARRGHDFGRADELRARIEAAGWKVVDEGTSYTLAPAHPPDLRADGRVVFGSAASVPSRLGERALAAATAIVVAGPVDATLATVRGLAAASSSETDVVVAAAEGSMDRDVLLDGLRAASGREPVEVGDAEPGPTGDGIEVLWMSPELGPAGLVAASLRRAARAIVILLEAGAVPEGDVVGPAASALRDGSVAAVGLEGLVSNDLHRYAPVERGGPVTALGPTVLAFRRDDVSRAEPDERLTSYAGVITSCSLALRTAEAEGQTRSVLAIDLPVRARRASTGDEAADDVAVRDPIARRDRYRIAARFADHPDLVAAAREEPG